MKNQRDFKLKTIMLNSHKVRALVPIKLISLDAGTKKAKEIFKKYN